MHGISNSRAYGHRVGLYKVLLSCGYKVLAVDYRGFADASKTKVTEETLFITFFMPLVMPNLLIKISYTTLPYTLIIILPELRRTPQANQMALVRFRDSSSFISLGSTLYLKKLMIVKLKYPLMLKMILLMRQKHHQEQIHLYNSAF